ncbi:hypothetical protein Droror1_Dr00000339 [Drosera rotundifolia]
MECCSMGKLANGPLECLVFLLIRLALLRQWLKERNKQRRRRRCGGFGVRVPVPDAGDKLVVVDFFSPGCGGCKALHHKAYRIRSFYLSNRICMVMVDCVDEFACGLARLCLSVFSVEPRSSVSSNQLRGA